MKKINISMLALMLMVLVSPFINIYAEEVTLQNLEQIETLSQEEVVTQENEQIIEVPVEQDLVEDNTEEELALEITDYVQNTKSVTTTTYTVQNTDKSNETNVSTAKNEEKISSNSGQSILQLNGVKSSEVQNYLILSNGEVVNSEIKSSDVVNKISVLNGRIISADKGIVQTLGGYDKTIYAYHTLEEAESNLNGIPLSGGGFDGEYLSTEEYEGVYYLHILISGMEGYISLNDAQIIPSSLIKSQSHYENVGGVWTYFEAIDPLISNTYKTYPISETPEWALEKTNYYSYDNENYSENNIEVSKNSTKSNYSYFQNLPFTSSSNYSASQYKSYLSHMGKSNSQYYNSTSAFVEAQNLENVNSLVLFAMANHEGAYGTSYFSTTCNNFFGWGAVDSNPENACGSFGYTTPRDGILSQAIHLTQMWGDITDWRFAGTEVGNKSHGINVYYASDPDWGVKVASHMYQVDSYLGLKENKKYRIYEIKNSEPTYLNYNKTLKVNNTSTTYQIPRTNGNPRVIVTKEQSDAFEYQLPTPKNVSSSTTCKVTDASNGSYPNYEGKTSITVPKGVASFACNYDRFSVQREWYPKKDKNNSITYNVINNSSIVRPIDESKGYCDKLTKTTTESGNKVNYYESSDSNNNCKIVYWGNSSVKKEYYKNYINSSHKITKRQSYMYNNKGIKSYYANTNYSTSTGYITNYKEYIYNTSGQRIQRNEKIYYSNGKVKQLKKFYYTTSNKLYNLETLKYKDTGKKYYFADTNYSTSTHNITDYKEYYYNTSGNRIQRNEKVYYSNGKSKQLKKFYYTTSNKIYNLETFKYKDTGKKYYFADTNYSTSTHNITDYKEYYYNASGTRIQRNEKEYYSNGKPKVKRYYYYYDNGNFKGLKTIYY